MTRRTNSTDQTPSQTVGPFYAYGLTPGPCGYAFGDLVTADLLEADPDAAGDHIVLHGQVLDGAGALVPDAMVEIWQADGSGRYRAGVPGATGSAAGFTGFGRATTGTPQAPGWYRFHTLLPGAVAPGHAPHVTLALYARGLLAHLFTRCYLSDDAAQLAADPVLALVEPARRRTLIAQPDGAAGDRACWRFDIHLQGPWETVFLDL